jgi:hypothetical protein
MEIGLTHGKIAIIDDSDYQLIRGFRWYAISPGDKKRQNETWYAAAMIEKKTTYMHRLIMGSPEGKQIDHIDLDGLNNKRENLRIVTSSENARNTRSKKKRAETSSQYKGVSWHRLTKPNGWVGGRWRAEIELPDRKRKIKYADSEIEAAKEYNKLALEYFGEHARLNDI